MLLHIFKHIKYLYKKKRLPKYFFFFYKEEVNFFFIKQICIWLLCTNKKKNMICKKCISCVSFLNNNHHDYYEINDKDGSILENVEKSIFDLPIISNIKIILLDLSINNLNLLDFIKKLIEKKTHILFIFTLNNKSINFIDIHKNLTFNFNYYKNTYISTYVLKSLYNFFDSYHNEKKIFSNENKLKNIDKIKLINSFIIFLNSFIHEILFKIKKKKKLSKIVCKNKISINKIKFILKLTIIYRQNLIKNNNLNIMYFINFFSAYMN